MGDVADSAGPLDFLLGCWEGKKGNDIAPDADRTQTAVKAYRERIEFVSIGTATNHDQILHGLRYSMTAWPVGEDDPFHEETGYWHWDADREMILRSFTVPRGYAVLAGGSAAREQRSFSLAAELGSNTFGIASNPYLDAEFRTERFEMQVEFLDDNSWRYEQDTVIRIKGQNELFHHRDANIMHRVS